MKTSNVAMTAPSIEEAVPLAYHEPNREIKATDPSTIKNGEPHIERTEKKINIDPEIQSLIPPLRPDELAKLRESISAEGCRDPLVIWKDHEVLLDGHNRYAICRDLGKPFSVLEKDFPDKYHAMIWILKNQLGRRNLSDMQFDIMVGKEYELQKKIGRGGGDRRSEEANQRSHSGTIDRPERTRDHIAQEHGISPQKVARAADLYNSLENIKEVAPEIAKKVETGEIKASKKDIRTLGKVLKQGTFEQKEQIVSELTDDFNKATETAKDIATQSKPGNHSSKPEASLDDHAGDILVNPEVTPTEFNSDLEAFLELAGRICCPKCGRNSLIALIWSCCGLSLDEAANLPVDVENEHISPADSPHCQVEEQRCENEEYAETVTADCAQKELTNYSEMAGWIPPDNSSPKASKILRMFSCLLKKDEAPEVDSLAKMTDLSVEDVRGYLENASWVRKDDSSPDGAAVYLPIEPSRIEVRTEGAIG